MLLCAILSAPVFAATHKIQVSDPAVAREILAEGGRLQADYGHFQLYEVEQVSPYLSGKTGTEIRDEYNRIELNTGTIDTTAPVVKTLQKTAGAFYGKRLHLIQFIGPVQPAWHDELRKAGVRVVTYIPQNTYLVYGDTKAMAQLQGWAATAPHVQWDGEYADDYKVHPHARLMDKNGNPRTIGTDVFTIQLVADAEANAATLQLIDQLKLEPIQRQYEILEYRNVQVRLAPENLQQIAGQPDVISIQPYFVPRKVCERQDQIIAGNLTGNVPTGPGYLAWLTGKGFTQAQFDASGFAVDVSDSGIDDGSTTPNHFGLYSSGNIHGASRVIYNRLESTVHHSGSTIQGCDGHGNLNAHIISGYDNSTGFPFADGSGYHYGLGVCPFVRVGSSVIFDPDSFTYPNYSDLMSQAYHDGARIGNNSWGSAGSGDYDSDAQAYDALVRDAQPAGSTYSVAGNQEMVIVFAADNQGPSAQTIGSPGTAKNVITVGAGENVQPFGGADGSSIDDTGANSANDIINFSSRGPCSDGRHKPELVAPGTHVSGGAPQAASPGPTGTGLACYDGSGVSGGVGGVPYYPSGQQFYTASSGTSHSTPCVAGGCALLRQYFINNFTNPPSPAMTKAFLMNSARYMTGAYANDTLWSDSQGMGEMNLGFAFDGTARVLRDEVPADLFTATGQTRTFTGTIADSGKPFRVTLAWTDAPGNTTGSAYNNNLDLTVTVGGNTYKGNVFSGAYSVTGGSADFKNNVESVFLPAGVSGSYVVTVTAANINSIGVPNDANQPEQDFALVVYNGTTTTVPVIVANGATLVAENCLPANGVIDPGETVTVSFSLKNTGNANTTNVLATLQAVGGVTLPSGPQFYGALTAGGTAVARSFTFTASGTCGGTITNVFQLNDGPANLGSVSFAFSLGVPVPVTRLTENFDSVASPALPVNWTTMASGSQSTWITANNGTYDTAPNAAFSPDPASHGVNELVSPTIPITTASAQLTFRHYYHLEPGYDGGVLEIKIGSGSFTDILSAGGSFVSNGYDYTLSSLGSSNPLAGRPAWSGDSGGFITTVVNLPAAAAGQNIQLKWRCGTDDGNYGDLNVVGWYVDTISVADSSYVCCAGAIAPSASFSASPTAGLAPLAVTFADTSTGTVTNRFWSFGDSSFSNTTATNLVHTYNGAGTYTVTLIVGGPAGVSTNAKSNYIVVTNPPPPVANFSATPTVGIAPLPVTFTDSSTGTITNRFWSFGDSSFSDTTATNLVHTYNGAGTNTVTLIVSGPGGVSTNTQPDYIIVTSTNAPPDTTPPSLAILSPADYQLFTNDSITVTGTASDASGINSVTVNGAAAFVLDGTNWSAGFTLFFGTNTITVIATDGSANMNMATQVVYAISSATNSAPVIISPPVVTNALLQVADVAVVARGETNVFSVGVFDADGDLLSYQWSFGDGAISDLVATNIASHAYTTNCRPYTASVTVSDGQATVSTNLTVAVTCPLTITKMQVKLNFAKQNADSASLTAIPDLGAGFSVTNKLVAVDIGGTTNVTFTLDAKGRGAGAFGSCKLAYNKKTGLWKFSAKLSKGSWQPQWELYGLANTNAPNPGMSVSMPVIVLIGDEAFVDERPMLYTAKIGKSGSAK
jgi:PKD repeat protein